jgi:RNA polymerase sigma-70 factor (sigma-E family)
MRGGAADRVADRLFRERYGELVRMARLLVDDTETAEEVVQEAFVRLYGGWRRLRDPERAEAYLRSSVWNLARDSLRRRRTRRAHDARRPEPPPDAAGPADTVVHDAHRSRVEAELAAALDRLPARQRECVLLRYWGELPEKDVAATLGIGTGSVKRHVHRALARLATDLAPDLHPGADLPSPDPGPATTEGHR